MEDEPTSSAAFVAECLRNSDVEPVDMRFDRSLWAEMGQWTASECRDVVEAAKCNTSIRTLALELCPLSEQAIDVFSFLAGNLDHVENVRVCDYLQVGEGEGSNPPAVIDRLLKAITKSRSDIKTLRLFQCNSPRGFLEFAERFPRIETLEIAGPCVEFDERTGSTSVDAFAISIAAALGRLPVLRTVRFDWRVAHPCIRALFSALHTSSSVKEVDVWIPDSADIVLNASHYCAITKTARSFICRGQTVTTRDGFVDLSTFFNIDPLPSFSPTIKEVQFFMCSFDDDEETDALVERAAKALKNVESLRLSMCHFPSAMKLLGRLPLLKMVSCLSRSDVVKPYQAMDEGEYSVEPYVLVENKDLEDFCHVIEQQGSLIEDVELDLVSFLRDESYPAIERLLQASRGSLVLNCGGLPWRSYLHVLNSAERIRPDLIQLRLRFWGCDIEDNGYADLIHAFRSNKTLAGFEIGLGTHGLASIELTISAFRGLIETNHTLQTLSIRGLTPDQAGALLDRILPVLTTTNRTLRYLMVHGARFRDLADSWTRFAGPILDMLKENYVLSSMEGLKVPKGDPVAVLLKQNSYGRRFLQPNDSSPIGIWATVLARISKDGERELMYKFLRAKPGVVRPHVRKRGRAKDQ